MMTKNEAIAKRDRLKQELAKCESGATKHYDEDDRGLLRRETTDERAILLRKDIADLERWIAILPD